MVEIILDPSIRDWVVLPMVIIFGCSAMVRHYVTLLLKNEKMASVEQLTPMNTVKRAQITRVNSKFISPDAFAMRRVTKVPFSLTQKFKMMLQRGIELNTLDVSYVSSVSWYFLVSFGMRGFLSLILGEKSASDDAKAMQMQMGMGAGPNMSFDAPKVYKQERVSLRLHNHDWALEFAEKKLLGEPIPTKPKSSAASSSFSSTTTTTTEKRSSKYTKISKRK
ncbi:hypothetical protein JG687_00000890 [Phytophthora cactorum]|uniref:ER membrane protein complex subunit 3 n=1 Tax=Phytophthora cactorum TaxID=29920 RepID=A0A8T1UZH7_9STRA|nr:hypothetical protein JG687_00000890 [Phytophthora cactorum]